MAKDVSILPLEVVSILPHGENEIHGFTWADQD